LPPLVGQALPPASRANSPLRGSLEATQALHYVSID
jgi:hypothetical protein